jgi:integrase
VAVTPSNAAVLREHLKARKQYLKSINPKFDSEKDFDQNELIFCHYNATPWLPNTISHAWEKLAKRTGLQHIRLHDARHAFASIHLKRGTHPKIVQEMLGHSSIQITLDT